METILVAERYYKGIKAFFVKKDSKTVIFINQNMLESEKRKCIETIKKKLPILIIVLALLMNCIL